MKIRRTLKMITVSAAIAAGALAVGTGTAAARDNAPNGIQLVNCPAIEDQMRVLVAQIHATRDPNRKAELNAELGDLVKIHNSYCGSGRSVTRSPGVNVL